ncbi:DUF1450 domain-containing protein [Bacillus licheniformis]|nr:DUF1450 domain-containing protein [Bacillus licheniformis]
MNILWGLLGILAIFAGSQEAKEILEKDPNLDVVEYGCLSYCGQCMQTMYALVNGEMVTANNPAELVENIYKFIDENELI